MLLLGATAGSSLLMLVERAENHHGLPEAIISSTTLE